MKKVLFFLFLAFSIFIVASLILFYNHLRVTNPPALLSNEKEPIPSPEFSDKNSLQIKTNEYTYRIAYQIIENPKKLTLIANFEEKAKAIDVIEKNNCRTAINGGFYTKSYQPLGLFMVKQEIISPVRKSELTNGFFWIDTAGIAYIAKALPDDWSNIPFILQTGPVIYMNGAPVKLSIVNDEPARRSLVSIDRSGRVIFLSIFDGDHPVDGPYLAEVPSLINLIEKEINVSLVEVINLDGGTASFFYSENLTLNELTLVGSLICEKE